MVRAVTCRHSIQNVRRAPRRSNASSESASEDTSWRKMEIGARLTWNHSLFRNPRILGWCDEGHGNPCFVCLRGLLYGPFYFVVGMGTAAKKMNARS